MENKPWKQTVGTLITAVWIYTLAGIFGSIISAIDTIHSGFDIIGALTGDGGGSGSFMSFWEFWDYMCTVLVVIGYILFYRSLNRFEKLQLNSSDTRGAHKVKISYILLILAAAAGLIPFAGWIIKLILIIISYVKLLSGYRSLKRSEVLPQQARDGFARLYSCSVWLLVFGIIGCIPAIGPIIEGVASIVIFFLVLSGWKTVRLGAPALTVEKAQSIGWQEVPANVYNLSRFTFETLLADPDNIKDNFESYLNHFSENVIDIIHRMDFQKEIDKLADNGLLYLVIKEFCTTKAYLGADKISSVDMGYIFEELVRKFSESYDEQAGAHFTARDIINLMAELLIGDDEARLEEEGIVVANYDMAMGTSQMLSCLHDRFKQIDPEAEITSYGQELNNQTFAIAKADTLIRGGQADNMRQGDTLGDDQFKGYTFDYIISNPPFGIEWKPSRQKVEEEFRLGGVGRFEPGLPSIGDGQMLFLLNGVAKLKAEGRMAIIQNGQRVDSAASVSLADMTRHTCTDTRSTSSCS